MLLASGIAVAGEPKPTAVDIKAFRDKLLVLEDVQGGTYVVLPGSDSRMWYGTGKTLYEQIVVTRSANGQTGSWDVGVWAPRVPRTQPGSIQRNDDGAFFRWCGGESKLPLKQITADRAKTILDKSTFLTSALVRRPHLLARDDNGTYYYVDVVRQEYGGSGYRVFVGKKGAMKQLPLTDVATDDAGEVFATKTGNVRVVHDENVGDSDTKSVATFIKGDKRTQLVVLDVNRNSPLIFKDLGIYSFLGTICDDL